MWATVVGGIPANCILVVETYCSFKYWFIKCKVSNVYPLQVQFAGKLRNICGLVWRVAFLQTVLQWTNFFLNVGNFSYRGSVPKLKS